MNTSIYPGLIIDTDEMKYRKIGLTKKELEKISIKKKFNIIALLRKVFKKWILEK